jgi:hypothetical protein
MPQLYDGLKSTYGDKHSINKLKNEGYVKDSMLSNLNNQVWVNKQKNKILFGVKGTNPFSLKDIGTDVYLSVGQLDKTDRYKEAKRLLNDAKNKYQGYDTSLIGHSLGASIVSKIGKPNDKVYAYNEGVSPFQPTRSRGGNHQHIRSQIDPVSVLGSNAKNMKTITNIHNPTGILPLDLLKSHNLESLKNSNLKI